MGTKTDIKSSNPSELQPLEEFDPNQEPVGELDETDDTDDQEQANDQMVAVSHRSLGLSSYAGSEMINTSSRISKST